MTSYDEERGTAPPSRDYHDYVFRNGRFVGDFEGMYQNSTEVPWHQDKTAYDTISNIDIAILQRHHYASICDVGCGLGYFTQRLYSELVTPDGKAPRVVGLDISQTCIRKAQDMFPSVSFRVADLLANRLGDLPQDFDLVVVRGVLWYVQHSLDAFLSRVCGLASTRGRVLVTLPFPPSDTWVGQDVLDSPATLRSRLQDHIDLNYWCVEEDSVYGGAPLCHGFGIVRT
ncbi:class I SAM-dependent methyltransferase [Stappia sp.]|uniref:class I SAM-dependent methyltransferase n=1 Tax=Stappia sp. TaxID=1870903 RepID=UPI0032D96781